MPLQSAVFVCSPDAASPKDMAVLAQAQTHQFNMPFQLAHPSHVPETDVPDNAEVQFRTRSTLFPPLLCLLPHLRMRMQCHLSPMADRRQPIIFLTWGTDEAVGPGRGVLEPDTRLTVAELRPNWPADMYLYPTYQDLLLYWLATLARLCPRQDMLPMTCNAWRAR